MKRYDPICRSYSGIDAGEMEECEDGDYVKFDDIDKKISIEDVLIAAMCVKAGITEDDLGTREFCEDCNKKVFTEKYSDSLRVCRKCQQFTKPF